MLASVIVLLPTPRPAQAHGTLAMSTPAAGATVAGPLTEVELYFTEQVAANAYFTVTAPGGARVDAGWRQGTPRPLDKPVREYLMVDGKFEPREYNTGFPAVVTLSHLPAAGQYAVSYLSVASDGEPVRGTMSFRYTGRVTAAPQGWRAPVDQPDPALVAAAEQHATSGHAAGPASGGPAASAVPTAPSSTAAPASPSAAATDDEGGLGWLAWTGAAALVVAAVGYAGWRRRPVPAGRPGGRSGGRQRGPGTTRRRDATARPGRSATAAGRKGTARAAATPRAATSPRPAAATRVTAAATRAATTSHPTTARTPATTAPRATAATTQTAAPPPDVTVASQATTTAPPPGTADRVAVGTGDSLTPAGADVALTGAGPAPGSRLGNRNLALVVGGLVVALLAGFGLGRIGADAPPATRTAGTAPATGPVAAAGDGHQHGPGTGPHTHPGDGGGASGQVTGLSVNAGGYTVQPTTRSQPAGVRVDYQFRIVGTDGRPATRFAVVHEKQLHLVVVGRDLSGYQHLHPTMAADGTWSVPLTLARPGGYRIYADFSVTGADGTALPLVLGVDHQVPGAHTPTPLPSAQPKATAGPFAVTMTGTPTVGVTVPLSFRVDGLDPARLERYLGAYGHLVVVREGDLGYVHVHPETELVDGAVQFWLTTPSAGRYRAYFDFQVDGKVHTGEYTLDLP
ncbi:copper resistance CopC family protein [Micromonospora rifamycinica]|uniref:copper resistance CopC family protein n=1 Tax=Micromonospora rifamycinica TaxID=291594 RepID=UPI0033DE5048